MIEYIKIVLALTGSWITLPRYSCLSCPSQTPAGLLTIKVSSLECILQLVVQFNEMLFDKRSLATINYVSNLDKDHVKHFCEVLFFNLPSFLDDRRAVVK